MNAEEGIKQIKFDQYSSVGDVIDELSRYPLDARFMIAIDTLRKPDEFGRYPVSRIVYDKPNNAVVMTDHDLSDIQNIPYVVAPI